MIVKLVSDLPEVYQPIHGHPELSGQVSRSCVDRLEHIARIHDALQHLLGRPLKVLDLGCAQAYFSLGLAERGAVVHGVDFLDKNIAVCNALALENPALQVSFETGRVEEVIAKLEPDQFDLVLGLSVFHHIVHEQGADAVKAMLEHAAARSGALIVELALREEPLYWAPAQPEDPRALLDGIAFVHEVARHGTHLAPIPRPLLVASNRYWILEEKAAQFDSWSCDPHALAQGVHRGTRRYFFSADSILKLYRFNHPGEYNKADFTKEVRFLEQPPPAFSAPTLIVHGERETDAWLAMQRLPGRLLLDLLREGVTVDSRAVLLAVLHQLAVLEAAGLYHDDVRTWNVLVAEDGATHLIDYGSISARAEDCVWPGNPFLSFFIFVREVATGVVDDPDPLRTISISPYGLPQPYRAWATSLWRRPLADWSFQLMYQILQETPVDGQDEPLQQPIDAWIKAIEEAIQAQKLFNHHLAYQVEAKAQQAEARAQQAEARAQQAEARAQQAEARAQQAEARAQQAEARAQQAEAKAQQAEAKAQQAEAKAQQAEIRAHQEFVRAQAAEAAANQWQEKANEWHERLIAIHDSTSWKITKPVRGIKRLARGDLSPLPRLGAAINSRVKEVIRPLVAAGIRQVFRHPELRSALSRLLKQFPAIHQRLLRVAISTGTVSLGSAFSFSSPTAASRLLAEGSNDALSALSPHGRRIYADLRAAIERKERNK